MLRLFRASQRESERPSLLRENASTFIGEGDGLTSLERKREKCICVLPSLVAHAIRYKTVVDVYNIVLCQTHVADFTMFAWYGK